MQMIQDGPYAQTPEKPLRMSGRADCCEVCTMSLYVCWLPWVGVVCVTCKWGEFPIHTLFSSSRWQKAKSLVMDLMNQKEMEVHVGLPCLFCHIRTNMHYRLAVWHRLVATFVRWVGTDSLLCVSSSYRIATILSLLVPEMILFWIPV